jgi:hypothetical protein
VAATADIIRSLNSVLHIHATLIIVIVSIFRNDNTYYKSKIGVINILEKRGYKDKNEDVLLPI